MLCLLLELHFERTGRGRSALRGCVKGCRGHDQSDLSHFGFCAEHSAENHDTNYVPERMRECLVCTHPAPLPTWCAILRGFVGMRCFGNRGSSQSRDWKVEPGTMHSRQARVELLISSISPMGCLEVTLYILELLGAALSGDCLLGTYTISIVERLSHIFFDNRLLPSHIEIHRSLINVIPIHTSQQQQQQTSIQTQAPQ